MREKVMNRGKGGTHWGQGSLWCSRKGSRCRRGCEDISRGRVFFCMVFLSIRTLCCQSMGLVHRRDTLRTPDGGSRRPSLPCPAWHGCFSGDPMGHALKDPSSGACPPGAEDSGVYMGSKEGPSSCLPLQHPPLPPPRVSPSGKSSRTNYGGETSGGHLG